jgi:hypothetical protein
MKSAAAFSAAVSRFGCTSVEHIDPDTSRREQDRRRAGRYGDGGLRAGGPDRRARPARAPAGRPGRAGASGAARQRGADQRDRGDPDRRAAPAPPGHQATPRTSGIASSASRADGQRTTSDQPPRTQHGEDGAGGQQQHRDPVTAPASGRSSRGWSAAGRWSRRCRRARRLEAGGTSRRWSWRSAVSVSGPARCGSGTCRP